MDGKLLLTIPEVADRLSLGRSFIYILVMRGEIPSVRIGRCRRVPAAAVEEFVGRLREEQAWVSDAEPDRPVLSSLRTTGNG